MTDTLKKVIEWFGKRKKVSALIAALFAAAYLAVELSGNPTDKVESAQKECSAVAKLLGMDCGQPPAKPED